MLNEVDSLQLVYLEIVDEETLQPLTLIQERPARCALAAYLGQTRLIDNVRLHEGRT